jgi:DNA-binding NarL/FixJ family response regulator
MKKKILLIEDEPQMRRNVLRMLELEDFEAVGAEDGVEGVALAIAERPDLILCDVTMPGLDGHGVLEKLRENPLTASIPFIFLTAKGERADLRAGMNLGADDYLVKPVAIMELLAAIEARFAKAKLTARQTKLAFDSAKPLEKLGLTPKESEVLLWIAQGKTNAEIGLILESATATVKKHVERVLEKLEAENRQSAALLAIEVLSGAAP